MQSVLRILPVALLWVLLTDARAEWMLLDDCESSTCSVYASPGSMGEAQITGQAAGGRGATQCRYTYPPAARYTLSCMFQRRFAAPVDLSNMTEFRLQLNAPVPSSQLCLVVYLIDENDHVGRLVESDNFRTATTGYRTWTYPLAHLTKSVWHKDGAAVNLARINRIGYRIHQQGAIATGGTFTFSIDQVEVGNSPAALRETVLCDFESETPDRWTPAGEKLQGQVERGAGFLGTAGLLLRGRTPIEQSRPEAVDLVFGEPRNLSGAKYVRVTLSGDPQLRGRRAALHLYLTDADGNQLLGEVSHWPARPGWHSVILPFGMEGIDHFVSDSATGYKWKGHNCWREVYEDGRPWNGKTDLSRIVKIGLSAAVLPEDASGEGKLALAVDDIRVGMGMEPAAAATQEVRWREATDEGITTAREEGRLALIYFCNSKVERCRQVEQNCFVQPEFLKESRAFQCFRLDIGSSRGLADRFQVYRVPQLLLLNRQGAEAARFVYDIDPAEVIATMRRIP